MTWEVHLFEWSVFLSFHTVHGILKARILKWFATSRRIARRDKKACLSANKQRKTIEWERLEIFPENQRYQENISCKDGLNRRKKWYGTNRSRRYEEEVAGIHRKTVQTDLHDTDHQDGVITYLEPDILKCEVKWTLKSIIMNKDSGDDGIPVELFPKS